tara:strand:+ start:63 stop:533 length:471 start_codon:yes stop_codon:yes gene_type:complete
VGVILEMKYDLYKIQEELLSLPDYKNQIYLQGYSVDMDPIEPTIGQNYLHVDQNESEYCVPLFDIPYINGIMKEHKLLRTRLMRMKPKTCYYWHNDSTKRLHIPIVTHEHCFLLVDGVQTHLPATGQAYVVDTTKMHTAFNASKIDRIHIVGAFSV